MTTRDFRDRVLRRAKKANITVAPVALEPLEAYYRLLARWNAKINLTALPLDDLSDATLDRLLIEPLAAAHHVPDVPLVWYDLGSGGGSPAIPLKIVRPSAALTMVEAKGRKAAFLREAVRVLGLAEASVADVRFEHVKGGDGPGGGDLVTVRAVKSDRALFEAAARLLRPGGQLLLFAADAAMKRLRTGWFDLSQTEKLSASPNSRLTILIRTAGLISG